jgi:hypothetical protein
MLCATADASGHTRGNIMSDDADEPVGHGGRLQEVLRTQR